MSKTKIEWADAVWNPITGCSKISAGCKNCYAEKMFNRLKHNPKAPKYFGRRKFSDVMLHEGVLNQPFDRKKPTRYFVNSMGDLFHENVTDEMRDMAFGQMLAVRQHTYMVLTKRPERMREYVLRRGKNHPSKNIWLGVTAENQEMALQRIPVLAETPAAIRFVSCEPLLSEIDLTLTPKLDWVIVGGETGHGARIMTIAWAIKIRDYCIKNNIPFFFKSKGELFKRNYQPKYDRHDTLLGVRYQEFPV